MLALNRLAKSVCRDLVQLIVADKILPGDVVNEIVARTDGVPLFVEELTKAVVAAGTTRAGREQLAAIPYSGTIVPAALHGSLMARLDRLGSAKEVAQIGAAIGREFSYELLSLLVSRGDDDLVGALHRLTDAGLLICDGTPPHATFLFKHALIQDAAYGTLLRERRRTLHAQIAVTLNENFPEIRATQPEILAHHYAEAGLPEQAIEWWQKAGERAMNSSAFNEAIAHIRHALSLAEELPESPAQRLLRLRLQTTYGYALLHSRGQPAPETVAAFAKARQLADGVDDIRARLSAFWGLAVGSIVRGELTPMRQAAEAFMHDAQYWPGSLEAAIGHRLLGISCWFQGHYVAARLHLEQAVAGYDPERDCHSSARFGYDPRVVAMFYLAFALWPLGDVERAVGLTENAVGLALQSQHVPTISIAHLYRSVLAAMRRKSREAAPHMEPLLRLAREHELPLFLAWGTFLRGWVRSCAGDREGEAEMRRGLALAREIDSRLFEPLCETLLAEVEAETHRVETALARLDNQIAMIDKRGQHWFDAEIYRVRGALLLKIQSPNIAAAEAAFMRAINVAQRQETRTFAIRSALPLAKLYQIVGRDQAAREVLGAALVGLSEGPELPEVGEAKRLLGSSAFVGRH
jgi:predicted ATPase